MTAHQLLKEYWGHDSFRSLQQEIIESIVSNNDTLALLPTGGGKSICYQIPALLKEGIALVITPLIALMEDQIQQLKQKGILALSIHSGMHKREVYNALENAVLGNYKLLYISPERLQSEQFQEYLKRMQVSMVAVDEAHCISEWGHEFRPTYRQIKSIRELLPNVPFAAFTATATPLVCEDIIEELKMKSPQQFSQKFFRENLSFSCLYEENKEQRLLQLINKMNGPIIIYARTRAGVVKLATFLNAQKIPTSYYHGGMTADERKRRQFEFMQNHTRVMVATNAFGMGIDKDNIRLVVHVDLPESIEAFYQEAGRAGRDGFKAYSIVLHQPKDEDDLLKKIEYTYPSIDTIQKVYQGIAHYYQLAVGSAHLQSFDFDMNEFCTRFNFKQTDVHYSLVRLEQQGILQLSEAYYRPPKMKILVSHEELYSFRLKHPSIDLLVRVLLRKFGGNIYNDYVKVSLTDISKYMDSTVQFVKQKITYLEQYKVIDFIEGGEQPQITYTLPRQDTFKLPINKFWLEERKQKEIEQAHAVIDYLHSQECRANFIVDYFGQEVGEPCGICDICVKNKKKHSYDDLTEHTILEALREQPIPLEKVSVVFESMDREHVLNTIRLLLDKGEIEINPKMCYQIKKKK